MFGLGKRRTIKQEKASNANGDRLMTAVTAMESTFFQWKIGLHEEEREKPEAAAVLMGMFDSLAQAIGVNTADSVPTFCVALGKATDPVTQNLDAGALLNRMLKTLSDPRLQPWVRYAGAKVHAIPVSHQNPTDTIFAVLKAVKAGHLLNAAQ